MGRGWGYALPGTSKINLNKQFNLYTLHGGVYGKGWCTQPVIGFFQFWKWQATH